MQRSMSNGSTCSTAPNEYCEDVQVYNTVTGLFHKEATAIKLTSISNPCVRVSRNKIVGLGI